MSAHVPAWKRLGLKLKNASEEVPNDRQPSNGKRVKSFDVNGSNEERPAKRQRVVNGSDVRIDSAHTADSNAILEEHHKSSSAHKSANHDIKKAVKFSTETKDEDGDSRKTIDFPANSKTAARKARKHRADAIEKPTDAKTGVEEGLPVKKNKKKSAKKHKPTPASSDKTGPALDYLTQHRSNRSSWKFNKNRDAWILVHALDTTLIPPSHVLALSGYLQGLPANAQARGRLIEQCQQALSGTPTTVGDGDKEAFLRLVSDGSDEADEEDSALKNTPRALLTLWALGETHTSTKAQASSATKVAKSRKSRTTAPIDISSSESESDSDRDTSSDESGFTKERAAAIRTKSTPQHQVEDDTSSFGGDSDNSTSDSSSDSDTSSDSSGSD